jgi:hypothetical protein
LRINKYYWDQKNILGEEKEGRREGGREGRKEGG